MNIVKMGRDIRLKVSELGLGFTYQEIADAIDAWFDESVQERLSLAIACMTSNSAFNALHHLQSWEDVISQFDTSETSPAYVVCVLKKFIWQVKRKMIGLPVTNHLMPVILGPQGVGKSTFVMDVLVGKEWAEFVLSTDFKAIEDDRDAEKWRNPIIFLDEMGYAAKTDIDNVKNKITAEYISYRPMRTNDSARVKQNATFVGCSNKELDQLIRDETGNRRFAPLRFSSNPDWARTKDKHISEHLWKSVDAYGDDPIIPVMKELRELQAQAREKSIVEQWHDTWDSSAISIGKAVSASRLYDDFREWHANYGQGQQIGIASFGKEFKRLIKSGQIEGWALSSKNNATVYVKQ